MKRDRGATRRRIIEQTAALLNMRGYLRTSMAEITKAAGVTKVAIYHHFSSREDLVLETFYHVVAIVKTQVESVLRREPAATEKLIGLIGIFKDVLVDDALKSGCLIVNLAVEASVGEKKLRSAIDKAIADLTHVFEDVIRASMQTGEFEPGDARSLAAYFVASLEGGIRLAVYCHRPIYLAVVASSLENHARNGLRQHVSRMEVG